ncbi:MAG: DUF4325 domain-containing protein [Deltaproteobacteria bacterium]|nr:DUF4325 domain-containing protein [Deltaproteobacteria bacterium]
MTIHANTEKIRRFIIDNVETHPADIAALTAKTFGITRQAVNRHLLRLAKEGVIRAEGATRAKRYGLKPLLERHFKIAIKPGLREDHIWREDIEPLLKGVKDNVLNICFHGFTEMLNNVFDHAEAQEAEIRLIRYPNKIEMVVHDYGVGIFNKIAREFHLDDERHAILELSKGKLTTAPRGHTGYGIFFTSRMFDLYVISSGKLLLLCGDGHDFLVEKSADEKVTKGTLISMSINPGSTRTAKGVYDGFADVDYGFTKTVVPVALAMHGAETLVSRSQAKRLMYRLDQFKEVLLDFKGIPFIGQAFADEIFRVFANAHPDIDIMCGNANEDVDRIIQITRASAASIAGKGGVKR